MVIWGTPRCVKNGLINLATKQRNHRAYLYMMRNTYPTDDNEEEDDGVLRYPRTIQHNEGPTQPYSNTTRFGNIGVGSTTLDLAHPAGQRTPDSVPDAGQR